MKIIKLPESDQLEESTEIESLSPESVGHNRWDDRPGRYSRERRPEVENLHSINGRKVTKFKLRTYITVSKLFRKYENLKKLNNKGIGSQSIYRIWI